MVRMEGKQQGGQQQNGESRSSSSFSSQSIGREERERAKRLEQGKETTKANVATEPHSHHHQTFMGRHRMSAAISHLNNQITTIQEEMSELETVGESSIVCKELLSSLDTIPDPLLPTTNGPADVNWDRWFRAAQNSKTHKRWI